MKKIKTLFVAALLSMCSATAFAEGSTNVTVVLKSGDSTVINVDETGALYFQNEALNLLPSVSSASVSTYQLSAIRKVMFEQSTGVARVLSDGEILLYPVPAQNEINIANAPASLKEVKIFNMSGKLVLNTSFTTGQSINISSLPTGVYVLNANGITAKFEKK